MPSIWIVVTWSVQSSCILCGIAHVLWNFHSCVCLHMFLRIFSYLYICTFHMQRSYFQCLHALCESPLAQYSPVRVWHVLGECSFWFIMGLQLIRMIRGGPICLFWIWQVGESNCPTTLQSHLWIFARLTASLADEAEGRSIIKLSVASYRT